jgi:hypothetical protein
MSPCVSVYWNQRDPPLLFSLLKIKSLYMFRALLAYLQEALHKRHLVYCVRVMSVDCTRVGVERWFHYTDLTPLFLPVNVFRYRCDPLLLTYFLAHLLQNSQQRSQKSCLWYRTSPLFKAKSDIIICSILCHSLSIRSTITAHHPQSLTPC